MSRRTAEANRAIAAAWEREQQLVNEGKGTRDWTTEQQIDILEKGKAYDCEGKAIEGHHMKSVSVFPEHQGNPDNIQFLSRSEHFDAHGGSYLNPTNGYYNPLSGKTNLFDVDILIPCEIVNLSSPIIELNKFLDGETSKDFENTHREISAEIETLSKNTSSNITHQKEKTSIKCIEPKKENKFVPHGFHKVKNAFRNFESNHPIASEVIKTVGPIVAEIAINYGTSAAMNGLSSKSKSTAGKSVVSSTKNNNALDGVTNIVSESIEKVTRSSPKAHTVSGYTCHRNGKMIEVASYPRGGKK